MATLIITLATVCFLGIAAVKYTPLSFVYSYFIQPKKMIKGSIEYFEFDGLKYFVYTPSNYDAAARKYPVIYHLHGALPMPWKVTKKMIYKDVTFSAYLLEKLVEKSEATPSIIVAPYDGVGMSMWSDDWQNKTTIESDIINKLIPHINATYATNTDRNSTTIQGFSMGGFGATKLGFKYPELFGKIVSLDGAIHNWETLSRSRKKIADKVFNAEDQFNKNSPWINSERYAKQQDKFPLRIFIVRAWLKEYNNNFHKHLQDLGVDCTFIETSCQHDVSCMLAKEDVSIVYQ